VNKKDYTNTLVFLSRVTLKADEAATFLELVKKIQQEVKEIPVPVENKTEEIK